MKSKKIANLSLNVIFDDSCYNKNYILAKKCYNYKHNNQKFDR